MPHVEILMPQMGESVFEATIVKCLKKMGEKVNEEDSIVEIATDKVDSEIPSSVSGTLVKWHCKEGDVVKVGSPVASIETDSEIQVEVKAHQESVEPADSSDSIEPNAKPVKHSISSGVQEQGSFLSPLVRALVPTSINRIEAANKCLLIHQTSPS